MNSKGKCVLRKRKDMLHEKLNQISGESQNIIELIEDIKIRAAAIVSDLDQETDERELLLKYPAACKKLEQWQTQISRISFDLDVLVCEENRRGPEESREPEESNTTSTASQGRQKVEKVPNADDVTLWTIPCPLQENDILDMRFVSGDSPHDFWLRFYSTIELKEIRSGIQKMFETNKLEPSKSSEVLGGDVCVCNGTEYIRGRVINQSTDSPLSYMVLNVDSGDILKVEIDKIYRLTEELAKFPVQAINCCLEGGLGDRVLWDARVVKLFHRVMEDSSLVVTICTVPTEMCSKFVVKVDVHNEMRFEGKIDLSSWITNSVLPTRVQKRISKSTDTLKLTSRFDLPHSKAELQSNASLKENSITDCNPKTQEVEMKENKDLRNLYAKDNANGISNSPKEKSNVLEPSSNVTEQSSSFVSMTSTPLLAMIPHKDESNASTQSTPFLSLNNSPVHTVSHIKEKANVQQQPLSVEQQSNAFVNLRSPALHTMSPHTSQYVPYFLPYQNPPMYVQMNPSCPVNQPVYPYVPQIQPPLLAVNPFDNAKPSVALQEQNQPWSLHHQLSLLAQNGVTKQHTSKRLAAVSYPKFLQSNAEDAQKGRGHKTCISLEDKQKEAILITNTLHATHQMETASIIKQSPSAEVEAFGEDISISEQETSSTKMNSKNIDRMSKVSLRYPNLKFEAGGRYQAFVVHINNPDDFYIHVACKDTAYIETLDQEITENYKTCSFKFRNKEQAKIMLHESWCAVFYEVEDLWHRGKVINWKDDNDTTLEVQYVDYGEVREVDLSMIKPLKEEYTKLPICATRCRLGIIHPPQLQEKSKQSIWPSETIELFKVLAVRDKFHSIVVTSASTDPISVLLVTEDKVVINKALLDWEYAIAFTPIEFDPNLPIQLITENEENVGKDEKVNSSSIDKLTQNCHKENRLTNSGKPAGDCQKVDDKENVLQRWNPMADDFFSMDNTQYRDDENACYAVSGYIPQDEQRICKFYAKNGRCFKGVTCTKEHSMPNPDGWTTDRETVLQNPFSYFALPAVGTSVTVEATVLYTLNIFYGHIFWEGRMKQEETETLLTLNRSMNSKDNISKMKRPRIIPAVGQLVLARFTMGGNSSFFRARVIDTNIEENKLQVVYVDYGNTEWVSEKNIREMEPQYLHLPFQAVECYISKVSPKTDNKEALLELSNLILGKQFVGVLISKSILGHAEIELWDGDQKVSDQLIEKGYADYRESPLFLSEGASIIPDVPVGCNTKSSKAKIGER